MTTGIRAYGFKDDFFAHDGYYWGPVSGVLVMTDEKDLSKSQRYFRDSFTLGGFALSLWVPEFFRPESKELALWFIGSAMKRDVALAMVPRRT